MTGQPASGVPAGSGCAGQHPGDADMQIMDSAAELFGFLTAEGERIAQRLGVPVFFLKALHMLDHPMAMKDLGRRMHCDPSFVTGIADMLEKRGLAAREPDPADRRVKRLVLTPAGTQLKEQVESEVAARLPWRQALPPAERDCLLGHITAMLRFLREAAGSQQPEEVRAGLNQTPPG